MNSSWAPTQIASTVSTALIGVLAAGPLMQTDRSWVGEPLHVELDARQTYVVTDLAAASASLVTVQRDAGDDLVAVAMSAFAEVSRQQVPLPADFARLLSDNLWDLYQR